MPELPEVEIARRQLERWLGGQPMLSVEAIDPAVVRTKLSTRPSDRAPGAIDILSGLSGATPRQFMRHGKRLGFQLGTQGVLMHLGMSGRFVRREEVPRFARLAFRNKQSTVYFVDQRRFGCAALCAPGMIGAHLRKNHGPDALREPPTPSQLREIFVGRRGIKVALLDQKRLAGLGNIHAVEILFQAKLHPCTPARALDLDQLSRLAAVIPAHLQRVVEAEEAGEMAYVTEAGSENPFEVYGRKGQPCPRCGDEIRSMILSGRSTFYCNTCQDEKD